MQLNVLNDLAEAMKALDGKKSFQVLHGVVVASIEVFFLFLVSCHAL